MTLTFLSLFCCVFSYAYEDISKYNMELHIGTRVLKLQSIETQWNEQIESLTVEFTAFLPQGVPLESYATEAFNTYERQSNVPPKSKNNFIQNLKTNMSFLGKIKYIQTFSKKELPFSLYFLEYKENKKYQLPSLTTGISVNITKEYKEALDTAAALEGKTIDANIYTLNVTYTIASLSEININGSKILTLQEPEEIAFSYLHKEYNITAGKLSSAESLMKKEKPLKMNVKRLAKTMGGN
ncbi:MAG: hypothetical protein KBD63_03855 [Bacteriovoracaceae bacterium]|nr:hypothetical protein [Bacteriovoracaceae bacterium]